MKRRGVFPKKPIYSLKLVIYRRATDFFAAGGTHPRTPRPTAFGALRIRIGLSCFCRVFYCNQPITSYSGSQVGGIVHRAV